MLTKKNVYFPGLNGVRAIAALIVIVSHCEAFKLWAGISNIYHYSIVAKSAQQGVKVFFVLSGYLITYLLLTELELTKRISVRKFYIRRIFRIWPLYYLIVILGFFVIPTFYYPTFYNATPAPNFVYKSLLLVFMLPNVLFYSFGHIFAMGPLWSVGSEEQFYLFLPHLLQKKLSKNKQLLALGLPLIAILLAKLAFFLAPSVLSLSKPAIKATVLINKFLVFDCMLIGGIFAFLYFHKYQKYLSIFYSRVVQITALCLAMMYLISDLKLIFTENFILSIIYGILLINISTNPKSILKLEYQPFIYIGKISYGMYMYHSFVIVLVIELYKYWSLSSFFSILPVSVMLTIIISDLSYRYFEKPILKRKHKYSIIKSGDEARK